MGLKTLAAKPALIPKDPWPKNGSIGWSKMIINVTSSYTNIMDYHGLNNFFLAFKKLTKSLQSFSSRLRNLPSLSRSFSSQLHFGHSPRHSPATSPPTSVAELAPTARAARAAEPSRPGGWTATFFWAEFGARGAQWSLAGKMVMEWENHGLNHGRNHGFFFENNMGYAGIEDWQTVICRKWGATKNGPKGWHSWQNDDKPWESMI